MGVFDFIKDAGEKIFQSGGKSAETDQLRAESIKGHVMGLGLAVKNLSVTFANGVATVRGVVTSKEDEEKILVTVGNIYGVSKVDDQIDVEAPVAAPAPAAKLYTVKSGDTLGAIAKAHYGDAKKYPVIFEANQPMLKDPNKIYPGQVLRIPPLS
jgi:nucleoid-associated protein YgaU